MARAAPDMVVAALAKNLPHRSRENEFTDGRVTTNKGQVSFRTTDGLKGFWLSEETPTEL